MPWAHKPAQGLLYPPVIVPYGIDDGVIIMIGFKLLSGDTPDALFRWIGPY